MLGQRRRRWHSIKTTFAQRVGVCARQRQVISGTRCATTVKLANSRVVCLREDIEFVKRYDNVNKPDSEKK